MPASYQAKLPVPLDWQELQRMTCGLYKRLWANDDLQEFGSIGQRQNGVDVFGLIGDTGKLGGIQCKCVEKFGPDEVECEYNKALGFTPALTRFVIVTTTKRDTEVQKKVVTLSLAGRLQISVVFWPEFCTLLAKEKDLLRKFYSEFMIFDVEGDCPGKLMSVDIDTSHFELVVSSLSAKDQTYGGTILVSDLHTRRCITYGLPGHWSRLEGVVGITRCDAFLVSKWLNSFTDIRHLLALGETTTFYELSEEDREEANDCGFMLIRKTGD